jgi:molecular chaperone GrpE
MADSLKRVDIVIRRIILKYNLKMAKKSTKTADKKSTAKGTQKDRSQNKAKQTDDHKIQDREEKDITAEKEQNEETASEDKSEKKNKDLEQKAKEWHDKYLRLSAEFDNYRKRTLKEKADLIRLANEDLLRDILPVVDDFERGMDSMDKSQDVDALKEGVHLIHRRFLEFLKQKGIKEIEAKDQPFNIDFHEAMTKIPAPSKDLKGKVVDVIEKGYILNEKVVRYAKVVVGD